MDRPVEQWAAHHSRLLVHPVLAPQEVATLVDEEDSPAGSQQALQEAPERLEVAHRDMGEEEAEEDDVVVVRGLQRERVRHAVADSALPHLAAVQLEHLGGRVGDGQLVGVIGQEAGPLSGAGGDFEHPSARREAAQRLPDDLRMSREGVTARIG
jgi:hypothetical protein